MLDMLEIDRNLYQDIFSVEELEAEPNESIAEQNIQRGLAAGREEFGPSMNL